MTSQFTMNIFRHRSLRTYTSHNQGRLIEGVTILKALGLLLAKKLEYIQL
jgi:hypothetical protein